MFSKKKIQEVIDTIPDKDDAIEEISEDDLNESDDIEQEAEKVEEDFEPDSTPTEPMPQEAKAKGRARKINNEPKDFDVIAKSLNLCLETCKKLDDRIKNIESLLFREVRWN